MEVYVVVEKLQDDLDWDFDCKIFNTMEKAKDYFIQRLDTLYDNYNCEYNINKAEIDGTIGDTVDFCKGQTSADYYDQNGSFEIYIDKVRVL